ncbi:predicted protein [Sclerotinia sclerotiorum 1980 UF-70]|uniref:Uncharacterized protein n=2 Tax=Sclerotinia sclerotiorum (strain ATCC 18683 / 1980 / Ss-1) TaxID=665079 RepID=A0A1D9QAN8_SCLS1|nr:predicted protein [Sclerotinia sclerotiorum 1980 UF-70]APA11986.1 hypothetical protein sscle_08g067560 [Sclerotinia sclerotiorum 1980 UF-70]EDO03070.1 predicted protein [Sclerotinia sclerotiorum 1980 UF-70]
MPSTYTKFSCSHVLESRTAAGRAKEEPPQALKRTLKSILSLGMAWESTASRTRTLHQPQPERLKLGLKRVFTLGKFEPPTLTSIEGCPNCRRNATFESEVYLGWVDEQPEPEASQPEEPNDQRPHTAQAVPQNFQTRREPANVEESPEWRRQQSRIPISFIRNRTDAREKVQKEADRDETLAYLEGRGRTPNVPHHRLGGYWDSEEDHRDEDPTSFERRGRAPAPPTRQHQDAAEEPLLELERNPFKSDEDSN